MLYTVYKIINLLTTQQYIGVHQTLNPHDDYMGSGGEIKRVIKKYGKENFKKEIIAVFDNIDDMYCLESELVNENTLPELYNSIPGGKNGLFEINKSGKNLYGKNGQRGHGLENLIPWPQQKERLIAEGRLEEVTMKRLLAVKKHYETNPGHFLGKTHTDDTKQKIGEQNKIKQKGKLNSQHGTMWITNPTTKQNKKIKKDESIPSGWEKGRITI